MGKAILRGLLCGIFTAVYIFLILISMYFNLIPDELETTIGFAMPAGCALIIALCLEKSRISRFIVSAIVFAAAMAALAYGELTYNLTGMVYRVFYGYFPVEVFSGAQIVVLLGSALAIVVGLLIAFVISIAGSITAKNMIDSLEIKE